MIKKKIKAYHSCSLTESWDMPKIQSMSISIYLKIFQFLEIEFGTNFGGKYKRYHYHGCNNLAV